MVGQQGAASSRSHIYLSLPPGPCLGIPTWQCICLEVKWHGDVSHSDDVGSMGVLNSATQEGDADVLISQCMLLLSSVFIFLTGQSFMHSDGVAVKTDVLNPEGVNRGWRGGLGTC